jgi:hypothetical protein
METSGGVLAVIRLVFLVCPLNPFITKLMKTETQVQTCTAGNVFVFEHSPLAQASALDRKKKRDELTLAQQAHVALCPSSMIACTVPGIDGAYEVSLSLYPLDSC